MKKFINVLLVAVFVFALVPLTSVHADGPELVEIQKTFFTNNENGFSELTQSLRSLTGNAGDPGYILRKSLFESKGKKVEYDPNCPWNFSFQMYSNRPQPKKGEIRAADCVRFEFVNKNNERTTYQVVLTRAYNTEALQATIGDKDPYDISATDPDTKKVYSLGWFFGSATGAEVMYQNTGDPSMDGSVYIEGSYTASGGKSTTVIKNKKVVFDAGEWAAPESDAAITTEGAPSPSLFTAPFEKDAEGSTIITFTLEPGGTATLWQGIRIVQGDEKPSFKK